MSSLFCILKMGYVITCLCADGKNLVGRGNLMKNEVRQLCNPGSSGKARGQGLR